MKKLSLLLAAGALAFASCQKTKIEDTPNPTKTHNHAASLRTVSAAGITKSSRGYLIFPSLTAYETALADLSAMTDAEIADWEQTLGYESMRSLIAAQDSTSPALVHNNTVINDDLFYTLVPQSGLIQIGTYLFRAVTDSGYVAEIDVADTAGNWEAFTSGVFIPGVSNEFSAAEDDAFAKLSAPGGLRGYQMARTTGIFGTEDKKLDDYSTDPALNVLSRADCKASYQKVVFYFSLMTEMKYMWRAYGAGPNVFFHPMQTLIALQCDHEYDPRGSGSYNATVHADPATFTSKVNHRPYTGARGLNSGWHLFSTFYYQNWWGPGTPVRVVSLGIAG